jgi:hypothetical protein
MPARIKRNTAEGTRVPITQPPRHSSMRRFMDREADDEKQGRCDKGTNRL